MIPRRHPTNLAVHRLHLQRIHAGGRQGLLIGYLFVSHLLMGCGQKEVNPPYQLNKPRAILAGDPAPKPAPPPALVVLKPAPHAQYRPGEKIDCTVQVAVPEGGRMPEVVNVSILKGGAIYGGPLPATSKNRGDGIMTLGIQLPAPKKLGNYTIQAEGLDTLFIEPRSPSQKKEVKTTRTYSPKVEIEVGQ